MEQQRLLFSEETRALIGELARISTWLRKERELAFYDVDFIPTEEYSREDAERALADSMTVLRAAERLWGEPG